ncbi:MAG: FixH family protein [Deltaproteobacteria bacterium]
MKGLAMNRLLCFALVASSLAACGGGGGGATDGGCNYPAAPLVSQASDAGTLQLALRTCPQPLTRALAEGQLTVTDPSGKPVDGLTVTVTPWMPAMGHGGSVQPTITPQGNGVYQIVDIDLYMPGAWQLQTKLSGPVTDSATLDVTVD